MRSYAAPVSIQKLFAILVALAVLFAPAMTATGKAFAAMPDHHAQMMEPGHCQMPPSDTVDHDEAAAKTCCISMCMAFAIPPSDPSPLEAILTAPAVYSERTFQLGLPAEIATPPPRSA